MFVSRLFGAINCSKYNEFHTEGVCQNVALLHWSLLLVLMLLFSAELIKIVTTKFLSAQYLVDG